MQIPLFPKAQPISPKPDGGKHTSESALSKRGSGESSLSDSDTSFKKSLRDDQLRNEQAADKRLADERSQAHEKRHHQENRVAAEKRHAERSKANEPVQQTPRKKTPSEKNPVDHDSAKVDESNRLKDSQQPTTETSDSVVTANAGIQTSEISTKSIEAVPAEAAQEVAFVATAPSPETGEATINNRVVANPLIAPNTTPSSDSTAGIQAPTAKTQPVTENPIPQAPATQTPKLETPKLETPTTQTATTQTAAAPVQSPQTPVAEIATVASSNKTSPANPQTSAAPSIAAVILPKPKDLTDTEATSDERRDNVDSTLTTADLEDSQAEQNLLDADSAGGPDDFQLRPSENSLNSPSNGQLFSTAAGQVSAAAASLAPETNSLEATTTSATDLNLSMNAAHVAEKFSPPTRSVIQSVINQVTETIASDTVSFNSTLNELGNRQLTLEINPPELGRLEIRIDSSENVMTAHIVASESITSEMLTREKPQLIEALKQQGIDLPDVDISYKNPRDQNSSEKQSNRDDAPRFQNQRIAPRSATNPNVPVPYIVSSNPSRINLVA